MNHSRSETVKRALSICVFLLCAAQVYGVRVDYQSNTAQVGGVCTTETVDAFVPFIGIMQLGSYAWDDFVDARKVGEVYLAIDHHHTDYQIAYEARVQVRMTCDEYINGTWYYGQVYTTWLSIGYDPNAQIDYKDHQVWIKENAYSVEAEVMAVEVDGTPVNCIPGNLLIGARGYAERYYLPDFGYLVTDVAGNTTTASNTVVVEWDVPPNVLLGAEWYDMEWVYLDNYKNDGSTVAASAFPFDGAQFQRNTTRVRVRSTPVEVPLIYDQGFLVFRVRPVWLTGDDFTQVVEGNWSDKNAIGSTLSAYAVSTTGVDYFHITSNAQHEPDLNWQYTATYAEEGKRKEVVKYFDGSLRERQAVTRLYEQDETVVAEKIYDHQGRPIVDVLPVPTTSTYMKYYRKFNQNINGDPYSREDFDLSLDCENEVKPLSTESGAGLYYSTMTPTNGRDTSGLDGYIPDAGGYPFVLTEYKNDQTGRVRRQSGVGADHKMGSDHETKYYYGAPMQQEVDRLFGTEIGYAQHYKKIMTMDPNGQVSVTYQDLSGKTIATALAGEAPDNLDALESNTEPTMVTEDLLVRTDTLATSLEVTYPINVSSQGTHTFTYSNTPQVFESCIPASFCHECVYVLEVSVTDECGEELLNGGNGYVGPYAVSIGQADGLCSDPILPVELSGSGMTIVDLPVGQYTVTKRLSLDEEAMYTYADQFLQEATCLLTYEDFLYPIIDSLRLEDQCDVPEPEDCGNDCLEKGRCEMLLKQMLQDMSPGGQYAGYSTDPVSGWYSIKGYPLSVLNEGNILRSPGSPLTVDWSDPATFTTHYRNPVGDYVDEDGNPAYVLYKGKLVKPQKLPLAEFIDKFQSSWAYALVPYHPEYCYYEWCVDNEASHAYDQLMLNTHTYAEAADLGLLNPLNMTGPGLPTGVPATDVENRDPYFSNTTTGAQLTYYQVMTILLNNYASPTPEYTFSAWQVAMLTVYCPGKNTDPPACLSSHTFGEDVCTNDRLWELFRAMYLERKARIQEGAMALEAIDNDCYNGCIGNFDFDATAYSFDAIWETDWHQPCHFSLRIFYKDKTKRVTTTRDALGLDPDAAVWTDPQNIEGHRNDMIREACKTTCEAYADFWMDALKGCANYVDQGQVWEVNNDDYDDIREELVKICEEGCDASNPYGATTVPPGSSGTQPYGFKTFQDVLMYFLSTTVSNTIASCTADLIAMPGPYGHHYFSANSPYPVLDICACDYLMENRDNYDQLTNPPPFSEYLYQLSGEVFPHATELLCACDNEWDEEEGWTQTAIDNLADLGLYVPEFITCNECTDCGDLLNAYNDFLTLYGGDELFDELSQRLLVGYINNHPNFGYNLSWPQIMEYIKKCQAIAENGIYYSEPLTKEAVDIERLVDYLARTQLLLETTVDIGGVPELFELGLQVFGTEHPKCWQLEITWTAGTVPKHGTSGYFIDIDFINSCDPEAGPLCTVQLQVRTGYRNEVMENPGNLTLASVTGNLTPDVFTECDNYNFALPQGEFQDHLVYGTSECLPIQRCETEVEICHEPVVYKLEETDCKEELMRRAAMMAMDGYGRYLKEQRNKFITQYTDFCINNADETFTMEYPSAEYHYTLYYYDRAGNLVRTVPPAAVQPITNATALQNVKDYREGTYVQEVIPPHNFNLASTYQYTSFNQVFEQTTPDGGTTEFWYDNKGRLVASQNAKQEATAKVFVPDPTNYYPYSYTRYDHLGRISEVGQVYASLDPTPANINHVNWPAPWGSNKEQVVGTQYDVPHGAVPNDVHQNNLRNRVATITYNEEGDAYYEYATHYTYDAHGNVDTLWQEYVPLEPIEQDLKKIAYSFDLVSGNVKEVAYQKGFTDQFFHRYTYDSDNRIIETHTSKDGVIWDRDAGYNYYRHGPLARMELGEHNVQGVDYAYTIHGWIKGVNSNKLEPNKDIGGDGNPNGNYGTFGQDAFGYSLSYYEGDYMPLNQRHTEAPQNHFLAATAGTQFGDNSVDLWNGNIRHMATSLMEEGGDRLPVQGTAYTYDQLNRLRGMRVFRGISDNAWFGYWTDSELPDYAVDQITYDPNGNIETLHRNGNKPGAQLEMDRLSYNYYSNTNRLEYVSENTSLVSDTDYAEDIDDQSTGNYTYDEIGNLVSDAAEEIAVIKWYVNGKIKAIERTGTSTKPDLHFAYGPDGQRIYKKVVTNDGTGDVTETWYVRDAQGNVMGVYKEQDDNLYIQEHYLYGSSRLGVANAPANIAVEAINITTDTSRYNRYLDRKHYELGNHLGNVLATVSGHKVMMQETVGQWTFGFEPGQDNIFDDNRHEQMLSTTEAHTGSYSIYQDYSAGGEWGPRVNIHVNAGDIVTISIYGLTENTDITKSGAIVKTLTDASGTLLYEDQNGQSPVWVADGWFDNVNWTQRGFTNYTIPNNLHYANGTAADMEEIYLFAYTVVPSGEGPTYFDDISITIQWADPINYYQADVVSYSDYYPFGMQMPGRNGSPGEYRFGFNGKEMDSEVAGSGNQYDYGFRIYNPRLGKFLSVDPLAKQFPFYTPYQFAGNKPIQAIDLDGLEEKFVYHYTLSVQTADGEWIRVSKSWEVVPKEPGPLGNGTYHTYLSAKKSHDDPTVLFHNSQEYMEKDPKTGKNNMNPRFMGSEDFAMEWKKEEKESGSGMMISCNPPKSIGDGGYTLTSKKGQGANAQYNREGRGPHIPSDILIEALTTASPGKGNRGTPTMKWERVTERVLEGMEALSDGNYIVDQSGIPDNMHAPQENNDSLYCYNCDNVISADDTVGGSGNNRHSGKNRSTNKWDKVPKK